MEASPADASSSRPPLAGRALSRLSVASVNSAWPAPNGNARAGGPQRTPVQWDATANAGFTTGTPWIGVNPDHATVAHYRRLIELRHTDPAVTDGRFELLLAQHPALWVFLRRYAVTVLLVAANLSAETVTALLPLERTWAGAAAILRTHQHHPIRSLPHLELRPWESSVWRLNP
jgi:oligo-1,6-glucosidase